LDIVALTSFNEGTPVSLIEAQAANKPIVSTKVGGIADIVTEGRTGLLAEVDDPGTFCQHMLSLVNDDTLRHQLGSNSQSYVMQRFSYQRLVNDMSELYHQLLEKKCTVPAVYTGQ
jgi:glycosyltransferase involved in cell wall biosynthesis